MLVATFHSMSLGVFDAFSQSIDVFKHFHLSEVWTSGAYTVRMDENCTGGRLLSVTYTGAGAVKFFKQLLTLSFLSNLCLHS